MTPDPELVAAVDRAVKSRNARLLPGGEIAFTCLNPEDHTNRDADPSARWNREKAMWHCDVCRAGGGVVDLARRLGVSHARDSSAQRETGRWEIRDAAGVVRAVHVRLEPGRKGKRKDCIWQRPDGRSGLGGIKARDLPLYGADRLARAPSGGTVIITEGEPARDALTGRGLLAVATVTGAKGTPSNDVLRALVGFEVVLWPDADTAGRKHMRRIAERLHVLGITHGVVAPWPDATDGSDAVDWLGTTKELMALVDAVIPKSAEAPGSSSSASATGAAGGTAPTGATPAARVVALADDFDCFHSPTGDPFVTVPIGAHRETFALYSRGLRSLLARRFYEHSQRVPPRDAIAEALGILEGRARFAGDEHPVAVRLAEHDGAVYLDLGDADWRLIEVTQDGWRVVNACPVRFRRPRGLLALPEPVHGCHVSELRDTVVPNLSDRDWRLLVAWLVMAFRSRGPYPVLELNGEQGAGKSTVARVLRWHLDPNVAALRAEPRDIPDLVIAANNSWCVALDNVSRIRPWLSDQLCRLATGGGYGTRELYSDHLAKLRLDPGASISPTSS